MVEGVGDIMVDYESIIVVIVINVVKCSGNILFYWE